MRSLSRNQEERLQLSEYFTDDSNIITALSISTHNLSYHAERVEDNLIDETTRMEPELLLLLLLLHCNNTINKHRTMYCAAPCQPRHPVLHPPPPTYRRSLSRVSLAILMNGTTSYRSRRFLALVTLAQYVSAPTVSPVNDMP